LLSKSHKRSDDVHTDAGGRYEPDGLYNRELAERLRGYNQFWIASNDDADRKEFLACFLPWLADALGCDLTVARNRPAPDRYFDVHTDRAPDDYLGGLSKPQRSDFPPLIRVQRQRPKWAYRLSALAVPVAGGAASRGAAAWALSQERTPRVTEKPVDELTLMGGAV